MSRYVLPCERCGVEVELPSAKPRQRVLCAECGKPIPPPAQYDELWLGRRK